MNKTKKTEIEIPSALVLLRMLYPTPRTRIAEIIYGECKRCGACRLTNDQFESKVGIKPRNILKNINALERDGMIEVVRRGGNWRRITLKFEI